MIGASSAITSIATVLGSRPVTTTGPFVGEEVAA
jgi:hypothetical protein